MKSCRAFELMRRPHFQWGDVSVLFQDPVAVVGGDKRGNGLAEFLDVHEDTAMNHLFLECSEEALCNPVGFRLANEAEACRNPPAFDLFLEGI